MKYVGNDDYCPTGFHQDQESLQLLNDAHLDLNMRMITGYHRYATQQFLSMHAP
jgi:hypothetical protein